MMKRTACAEWRCAGATSPGFSHCTAAHSVGVAYGAAPEIVELVPLPEPRHGLRLRLSRHDGPLGGPKRLHMMAFHFPVQFFELSIVHGSPPAKTDSDS